jgi:ArsR family transcriptional regulator
MEFNDLLKLLADDNRSKIIRLLRAKEVCVCDLAEKLDIEQSLLSHHLKKLKLANLLIERKIGRWVHYSLNKTTFAELENQYLESFGSAGISEDKCDSHIGCCVDNQCNI